MEKYLYFCKVIEICLGLDKIKYIPANNPVVCIFSLGGFSEYVKENAKKCKLITLDDMYN